MRLYERDKKDHWLRRPEGNGRDEYNEPRIEWGEARLILAVRQPLSSQIDAATYGEQVKRMYMLLCDGEQPMTEGDRLCIFAPPDEPPDYKVVSAQVWNGHRRYDVQLIPEHKRRASDHA